MLIPYQFFPKRALIEMGTFYRQWKCFTPPKVAEKSESPGYRPVIILTYARFVLMVPSSDREFNPIGELRNTLRLILEREFHLRSSYLDGR